MTIAGLRWGGIAASVVLLSACITARLHTEAELTDRPAFTVQYHPEGSPGPQDSFYLFERFVGAMK